MLTYSLLLLHLASVIRVPLTTSEGALIAHWPVGGRAQKSNFSFLESFLAPTVLNRLSGKQTLRQRSGNRNFETESVLGKNTSEGLKDGSLGRGRN